MQGNEPVSQKRNRPTARISRDGKQTAKKGTASSKLSGDTRKGYVRYDVPSPLAPAPDQVGRGTSDRSTQA